MRNLATLDTREWDIVIVSLAKRKLVVVTYFHKEIW